MAMEESVNKIVFLCFLIDSSVNRSLVPKNFELNIIHMNDIHAHFDEINLNAGMNVKENILK